MSQNKADFFPPKQFPQRVPNPPPAKPQTTTDPDKQAICECGCRIYSKEGCFLYVVPGQIVGTVDVTFATAPYCVNCLEPFNLEKFMKKKEAEKKQPEGA